VQSDACFEAMQIDWPVVRQQAICRDVIMTRVAVRDFDHNDQVRRQTELQRSCLRGYLVWHMTGCIGHAAAVSQSICGFWHRYDPALPYAEPEVCMVHN